MSDVFVSFYLQHFLQFGNDKRFHFGSEQFLVDFLQFGLQILQASVASELVATVDL